MPYSSPHSPPHSVTSLTRWPGAIDLALALPFFLEIKTSFSYMLFSIKNDFSTLDFPAPIGI